ncbi:ABC transporter ATP-binding protein [Pseudohalocynthiibacter aestuariivivens]|nr:ABC transporter ATP-binding protein [Pseudohalocynthiibacter aestuariivivens]QIE44096.1 ABC transporter ATP-binding protein [Pseudohalocynthiibacter aestuariivivens]
MSSSPLLSLRNVCVSFDGADTPGAVLRDLSLHINAGEVLCLVGASGAGKSIASLVALRLEGHDGAVLSKGQILLDTPDGQVNLAKMDTAQLRALRGKQIGLIFQDPSTALNPVMTVGAQLVEILSLHRGLSSQAARAEALTLLHEVQMPEPELHLGQYPHELSGGQRQRVMIAIALSGAPRILIADEPTTALDVRVQAGILTLLDRLRRDRGIALLLITHDMGVVAQIADRIAVIEAGTIVEEGTVREVFSAPRHPETQRLLKAAQSGPTTRQLASDQTVVLEVRSLSLNYPRRSGLLRRVTGQTAAVRDVSFGIDQGETLALVGESGSGKSSVARALMQLEPYATGEVLLEGMSLTRSRGAALRQERARIQMVFQDPSDSLDPRLTLGAQVAAPLHNFKVGARHTRNARVEALFRLVRLDPALMQRYPHQVSGGQCQRVAIARALALQPAVLIADESVTALDAPVRAEILDLFARLQAELGLAILFISHDIGTVSRIAQRIAVMHRGRIVEHGPTSAVLAQPAHGYTRALLDAVVHPDPERRRQFDLPRKADRLGDMPDPEVAVQYRCIGPKHFVLSA